MTAHKPEDPLDEALAALLAPPSAPPDRLFAARVDRSIDELNRLRRAERHYARGVLHDVAALVAATLAALVLVQTLGVELGTKGPLLGAVPLALMLLVLLGLTPQRRRPRPDI
jgi:hypothetical protein